MFATSLRRRASFAPAISALIGSPLLALQESDFEDSDIRLPTLTAASAYSNSEQTRVLLLSTSGLQDDTLEANMLRVRRLFSVTGGHRIAIIFLMHPPRDTRFTSAREELDRTGQGKAAAYDSQGALAYARLQTLLFDEIDISQIPIFPLVTLGDLPTLLSEMCHRLTKSSPQGRVHRVNPDVTTFELLQRCTVDPPLAQETAFFLSDIFANLSELARTCSTANNPVTERLNLSPIVLGEESGGATGQLMKLRDLVGEAEMTNVIGFWKEEWIAE